MNDVEFRLNVNDLFNELEPLLRRIINEEFSNAFRDIGQVNTGTPATDSKDLLTTKEAADYLGVSPLLYTGFGGTAGSNALELEAVCSSPCAITFTLSWPSPR